MIVAVSVLSDPPRANLLVSGIPSSAVYLTITRTAGGESLRIPGRVQMVGPEALVVDTAVAPGRINTYLVEAFDSSGALVANATQDAAGPVDSACAAVWLSDPLDETSGLWLEAQVPSASELTWAQDVTLARPIWQQYPRASAGRRQGLGPFTIEAEVEGPAQDALLTLLRRAPVLCVRLSSTFPTRLIPPVLYAVCEAPVAVPNYPNDRSLWRLTLTPTQGPSIAPIISGWSWDDLAATGWTWAQVADNYDTWWDLAQDNRTGV